MGRVLACRRDELPNGKMKYLQIDGNDILLANVDGAYYAVSDICNHAGANLHEGKINGKHITCPWHKAVWDVTNGELVQFPVRLRPLKVYKVIVDGDAVYVEV
ncbi:MULTISPECIES: Rieske (2Fe-2S) protein [Candidatus Nitrosocaldus]|jgi:nitrite reductase/ring-hydroxylating ferredoxin subunit|uniref:Putative rieske (2Fe-2S) domain protein n=1 Tax=Candidatus Nitrosocaldus cavascurensis TaxID=2058097 RepID=A0A2K5ASR8_9ARCH|nr:MULTISPECIES: Rieske 2Fe-2S domain-containing protein [Candidatus Nitrosocaldus]SPC34688.1 putative rieske (2Fe-2S) domain protein [Candidatus Nitrosocaldus cavascurensis]